MASVTPDIDDQSAQDRAYSPEELKKREQEAQAASSETPEGVDGAREAEENPSGPAGAAAGEFVNNFTGKAKQQATKGAKSFLKKRGPIIAIGGGIGIGGIALLVLVVPSILLFHLLANMFGTMDPSATALSKVAQIMLLNKLGANDATLGSCNTIKIACRFKTPTNELLSELKDAGITPHDAAGNEMVIDTKSKWPTERPSSFSIGEGDAKTIIEAKNLKSALQLNTEFRVAFNKVVKRVGARAFSRFSPGFLNVIDKFKLKLRDQLAGQSAESAEKKTLEDAIEELIKPEGANADAAEIASKDTASIAAAVSLRVNKLLTLVAKTSKGSGVVLAMALQCMANEVPGMIVKAMTAIQQTSMVAAGAPVITAMTAVQAGDSTPDEASQLGTAWTQTNSDGKSALDSAGAHYALYGDKNVTADPTYENVTPAAYGSVLSTLNVADKIMANPVSNVSCGLLMNPVSGAAIAAGINAAVVGSTSLADFGTSFLVNFAIGGTFTLVINSFSDGISNLLGGAIAPALGAATQPTIDKMAQPGPTFGNVETSTVGALASASGAQTFGQAQTTDSIQAYAKQIQAQQLADAEYDRSTLSPFDASSRYTFLGSILNNFLPYYSSLGTIGGSISAIGGIIPTSFSSLLNLSSANAASDPANLYTDACPDTSSLQTADGKILAADIFCHPVYASTVPDNWDPTATESAMEAMDGAIDSDTGDAIKHDDALSKTLDEITSVGDVSLTAGYSDWLDTCTDTDNAAQCTGGDATEDTYSLYTAAKNVNDMLDADLTSGSGSSSDADKSNTTTTAPADSSTSTPAPTTDTAPAPTNSTDHPDSTTPVDPTAGDGTDTTTTTDTSNQAGFNSSLFDASSNTNVVASTAAQTVTGLFSVLSSSFDLLKAYNASVVASFGTHSTLTDIMESFTPWL